MVYPCFFYAFRMANAVMMLITSTTADPPPDWLYRLRVCVCYFNVCQALGILICHPASTLLYAVAEPLEMMEKMVEDIVFANTTLEWLILLTNTQRLIRLINRVKTKFSTIDVEILKETEHKEKRFVIIFWCLAISSFALGIGEVFLSPNQSRVLRRAEMYHYSNIHNRVPVNFWLPAFLHIDLSQSPTFYIYLLWLSVCAVDITALAVLIYPTMGTFSIHIKGQLLILIKYINLLSNQERDSNGNLKYYTNIVTGQYFTWSPGAPEKIVLYTRHTLKEMVEIGVISSKDLDERDRDIIFKIIAYNIQSQDRGSSEVALSQEFGSHFNPVYEEYFMTQIVQYHQFLFDIKERVQRYLQPVVISTCFYFITLAALLIQILLTPEAHKFTFGGAFILLNLNVAMYVKFSDSLEECNLHIQSLLFSNFKWYTQTPRMKAMLKIILVRSAKPLHFSFHGKFVTFDRPLLLTLFSLSYKLINWLFYMKK